MHAEEPSSVGPRELGCDFGRRAALGRKTKRMDCLVVVLRVSGRLRKTDASDRQLSFATISKDLESDGIWWEVAGKCPF